jgi:cytochrome P450
LTAHGTAADFASAEAIRDPYTLLARLRREDPVHWNGRLGAWCLSAHADVERAFKDPRLSSDRIRPFVAGQTRASPEHARLLGDCLGLWMVFNDPPTHTRLRGLVAQAFTRRAVEALRPQVAALVHDLLDAVADAGRMDVVADFAYPLPATVIADMLGVPRADVDDLKRWSDDLATFVLAARANPEKYAIAAASLAEMNAYFERLVAERRARPGGDIIDALIAAHAGEDRLTLEELLASCVLLLFAGHETTTHFIANGLRALVLHPEAMADFRAGADDRNRLRNALNELLRWDGPSISQLRVAAEDLDWGGRRIARGERVYLFIAGANRDEAVFPDPDRLDLARPNANRQLAFGSGIHLCLGAHLARLEGEVAFPILADRLAGLRLLDEEPEWSDSLVIRGMRAMPVAFEGRARA